MCPLPTAEGITKVIIAPVGWSGPWRGPIEGLLPGTLAIGLEGEGGGGDTAAVVCFNEYYIPEFKVRHS